MIRFTQFLLPHGEQRPITIERGEEVEKMAAELVAAGCEFEIEMLRTSEVSLECVRQESEPGEYETLAAEICENGPKVPEHVDKLVRDAHATWKRRNP